MYEVGRCIGNDMLDLGAIGLYGPAMNTHRNAYCGRNFEYYSEDPYLGGMISAAEVKGIQDKGRYVYIKHFALNDSETNCRCASTWVNEQTIREIYLKPFQMAIEEGGAMNVMNAFSRFTAETESVAVTPWWQTALYALCVVMALLTLGSGYSCSTRLPSRPPRANSLPLPPRPISSPSTGRGGSPKLPARFWHFRLGREPFGKITVQDILNTTPVSRASFLSTFIKGCAPASEISIR